MAITPGLPALTPLFVRLANAAYMRPPQARMFAHKWNVQVIKYFNAGPAQAYMFGWRNSVAIVPRGTQASQGSVGDLLSNAGFFAHDWVGPGKAHLGYSFQFELLRRRMEGMASDVTADKRLYLVGHSMGGAIATLFASWLSELDWNAVGLVTFGAPRSLDKEGGAAIRVPSWRVVNRFDFAPHWPPTPFLRHHVEETKVDSGGWIGPVSRHTPTNYITAVDKEMF